MELIKQFDKNLHQYSKQGHPSLLRNEIKLRNEVFQCPELLFQPQLNDIEFDRIDKTIVNSIKKCDSDLQSTFFSNIIISGGSSMFNGLADRLEKEINKIAQNGTNVNVIALPEREYSAWTGGSIIASLDNTSALFFTKDEYNEHGSGYVHCKFIN